MGKLIFISNRLPVTVSLTGENIEIKESIGGLATGLRGYHQESGNLWLGWSGLSSEEVQGRESDIRKQLIERNSCIPLFLSEEDIDLYYQGFSNSTIWPLFHYFPNLTSFDQKQWLRYQEVNRKFLDALEGIIEPGDRVWIHDYQLMLLPQMIREEYPQMSIGFFLHIPFPSFELFRLLPWREEVVDGLLGADLLGFHTYDYARHFLSSVRRIKGNDQDMNVIKHQGRNIRTDVFPMGIDYDYFSTKRQDIQFETAELMEKTRGKQVILSVDRLDYTKGIPERIEAYAQFLNLNPEYREKVALILIVAPSRAQVDLYSELLREIQELVSQTNGKYGTLGWVPIWFFYRSFSQESLIALYKITDAMMVTPLRDGMNLVAKEYIASRSDLQGMLIISETAGASSELGEAVVVNPNNQLAMASGIKEALDMTKREQIERNSVMHTRLKRYNIHYWTKDFIEKLDQQQDRLSDSQVQKFDESRMDALKDAYREASSRLIFLDYDGTLKSFQPKPDMAYPDEELIELLKCLEADPKNHLVIISGRDRITLEKWLGHLKIDLVASHGLWLKKYPDESWLQTEVLDNSWKDEIRPILEMSMDRTPGSLIEEKEFSLAWHYRKCEPELAEIRLRELTDALLSLTSQGHIGLLEGNMVLEVKDTTVNKGRTASSFLTSAHDDFILAAGDDTTDEDLFGVIPENQFTFKVGKGDTKARFMISDCDAFRALLKTLTETE